MKDLENHVATGEQEQPAPRSSFPTSLVAQCCINSAVMLRYADRSDLSSKGKLKSVHEANEGQSRLLIGAAYIADEMLAALEMTARDPRSGSFPTPIQNAVSAAIAKATGEL